jgi:hypothetical protein
MSMSGKIKLNDELTIEKYPFSEYITCVEVKLNGDSYQSFCTSTSQIEEWEHDCELLAEICYEHIKKFSGTVTPQKKLPLSNGLEVDSYPFSDYIHCVDIYQDGKLVNSFCCDTNTFKEYQDDMDSMVKMYHKIS